MKLLPFISVLFLAESIIKIIHIGCYKQGKILIHVYGNEGIIVYDSTECTGEFLYRKLSAFALLFICVKIESLGQNLSGS